MATGQLYSMATDALSWLKSKRDYFEGLAVLRAAGVSGFMMSMLEEGPDVFNTPALLDELEKLAQVESRVESQEPGEEAAVVPPVEADRLVKPANDLEKKLRLDQKIRDLFREITHLHGQLSVLPEGDRLHEAARTILLKNIQKQRLWDQLNYFQHNGHWFDELPENQPKPKNLEQSIKNAMSNRAKAKKYLENPLPGAKKLYYESKVAEWTAKIDQLISQRDAA